MRKRLGLKISLLVVVALAIYLSIPTNHYIVKALIYQKPKIHHNTIFANRTIEIGNPEPWQEDSLFNRYSLSANEEQALDKYKTVAFLVARDSLLLFEKYWEGYGPQSHSNSVLLAFWWVVLLMMAISRASISL